VFDSLFTAMLAYDGFVALVVDIENVAVSKKF
jgi:hypothetical protein